MIHLVFHALALIPLGLMIKRISNNLRILSRKFFFAAVIAILFWVLLDAWMQASQDPGTALALRQVIMLDLSLGTLFLVLTGFSLAKKSLWKGTIIGIIPLTLFAVLFPSVEVVQGNYGFVAAYANPGIIAWQASVIAGFLAVAAVIYRLRNCVKKENWARLKTFSIGAMTVALSGIIFSQLAGLLGIPNLSAPAGAFSLLITLKAFS